MAAVRRENLLPGHAVRIYLSLVTPSPRYFRALPLCPQFLNIQLGSVDPSRREFWSAGLQGVERYWMQSPRRRYHPAET